MIRFCKTTFAAVATIATVAIVVIALSAVVVQPVLAGQRTQIAKAIGCIKTIVSGDPILGGIHTGKLPVHVLVRRCGGLTLSVTLRNGVLRSTPLQNRFIPRYTARSKGLAIPDARVTISPKNIREAWLTRPNQRYDHAILGDNIEAGGLAVNLASKRRLEIFADKGSVFEDRIARLVDLDGDGENEIVVVRTLLDRGASLAVYGVSGLDIIELAETDPIGLSHRWLNPAVAADFDGDGKVEIAWVETPHIGGILKVARLTGTGTGTKRQLKIVAELSGFSNHTIGSRELMQAVTFDWDKDGINDIILPGAQRQMIRVVSLSSGQLKVIDEISIDGEIASPLIAADLDGNGVGEVLLVTKDAQLLSFSP